jgi:serine/threonine-protein kinase RsbW
MVFSLPAFFASDSSNMHAEISPEGWVRANLSAVAAIHDVMDRIEAAMKAGGYPNRDVFAVRLALEEAVVNAIKHGHQGDPSKVVHVQYGVGPQQVVLVVEDQGPGFRLDELPDPLDPENLERPCGRGVFLIQHYMDEVKYNDRGNCVTLCKRRS